MSVRVASASESVACERATIEKGTKSAELMRRAGKGAAGEILVRCAPVAGSSVAIFTGSGNNGGDGWIVAGELAKRGFAVRVVEVESSRTPEAKHARDNALRAGAAMRTDSVNDKLIVDALLGTGATGAAHGRNADAIAVIEQRRRGGATVVSLDLPSGLNATTGASVGAVVADLTFAFGTLKRGALISRANCGEIVVLDIGLDCEQDDLPLFVDAEWVSRHVPPIPADAHKGTRGRLAILGGGPGMAGATILAGRGALRSGIGLLTIVAASANATPIHSAIPAALFQEWPSTSDKLARLAQSADAIAIGPGLGRSPLTRDLVESVLLAWTGPVVIDADGLNVFAGDLETLASLLAGRPSVITPHPAEMGRLLGVPTEEVLENRFEIGLDVASKLHAAVLLKGTPTTVFSPTGERFVSATGTAALATGGSGDILTGVVSTLLAQMAGENCDVNAAACGAFIHGRAAELCGAVRGTTLDDILRAFPAAWNEPNRKLGDGIIGQLPSPA